MAKFRNISPLGALDIALVGGVVEAGEEFEVTDEQAEFLVGQVENFERIWSEAELKARADEEKQAAKIAAQEAAALAKAEAATAQSEGEN